MSKIERLIDENFNIKDLINQKEKEYEIRQVSENATWGNRGDILNIGKPMDKLLFHRGKTIASARKQIELLYDWFLKCEDRRTRVIGKAWFEEIEGVFDQMRQSDLFADFFTDEDEKDTEIKFRQRFYTYQKAMKFMKQITEDRKSQYILTNPVFALPHEIKNHYGKRSIDRLTEMHVLYAEIDHYKMEKWNNKTAKQIWKVIKKHLIEQGFPLPTEVVFSRGIHLYWKHAPIPAFMIDEWRMLMKYVNELLSDFGADTKALDPVRILRAVGSIHEKIGEKITGLTFTNDRYDFMELFNTYCHEKWQIELLKQAQERQKRVQALEKRWIDKQHWMFENGIIDENGSFTEKYEPNKKAKRKRISTEAKSHRYNSRHKNIIDGVFWLSDVVRKGNMDGCRENACYLVRVHALRVTGGNIIESNRLTEELYSGFSPKGYTWNEMMELTQSAETDYKRWVKNETLGVRYSTEKLIKLLKITAAEMKDMRFIVDEYRSKELKMERDRKYQEEKRKENGSVSNEELRKEIEKLIKENPALKDYKIAKMVKDKLGKCSDKTVKKVRSEIQN